MKRHSRRLTFRIFLITLGLLLAVSAIICGTIAYLTPISYTSLVRSELLRESDALLDRLHRLPMSESERELNEFSRKTGAYLRCTDSEGNVLFDTFPMVLYQQDGALDEVTVSALQPEEVTVQVVGDCAEGGTETSEATEQGLEYVAQISDKAVSDVGVVLFEPADGAVLGSVEYAFEGDALSWVSADTMIYPVAFADGQAGELLVQGGTKAVNQSIEVLKSMLPFLLAVVVGISLLGALCYAVLITRPIIALSRIAGRMASLDFDAHWSGKRRDEIGALGRSLNTLSGSLSKTLQQLRESNAALQADIDREKELEQQRTAFFAAASHELKTPVTILKGQLSGMLAQVGIYKDREKYLARALEVTGRMENLIREILVISRIESSQFTLGEESIDFSALARAQFEADAEMMETKQLTASVSIAPDVWIAGNRNLLANALDNIYMNAILYSPPGECIRLDLTHEALRLENTGVFIPTDQLANLFTPFFRVEQSRNRRTGGSGLGLYLVKSIFALHGISCQIQNTAEGVCFTADLKAAVRQLGQAAS